MTRAGKYSEAIPLAQLQVANLEKSSALANRDLSGAPNNLALLCTSQGQDSEAEPLYTRALSILEKTDGFDRVAVARRVG
jgi:hypothetical protein